MKLDIFTNQWLDLVFEGRNKKYGAYELRKENPKTSLKALFIGAFVFAAAISAPMIINMIPSGDDAKNSLDEKVVLVNMDKPKENIPPPPPKKVEPPKPKVDEVKFVKPKVVEAKKVTEEIKTIEELKDKNIAEKDQKGDENAKVTIDQPTGDSDKAAEVVDNNVYSSAGIEVQPEFPGGNVEGWQKYIRNKFKMPEFEQDTKGKIFVEFVVEKDGSLTDVKVLRDVGYGSKEEAMRIVKNSPRWKPGIQNGKPVRTKFMQIISIDYRAE
ncbi:MAG: energy transducer TonB [Bacteroidota bacterium]